MLAARSLLFNIFFFAWHVVVMFAMIPLLFLPSAVMKSAIRVFARGMRAALRLIVGLDFEVRGRENIPVGAAVFASKHQSTWETFIFHLLVDDSAYVLKKELMRIPLWGWCVRKGQAIIVDRQGGARSLKHLVRQTLAALAAGRQVVVFPEGTRMPPGERGTYFPGIAAIYRQAEAPMVPVALNSGLYWGRRSFLKHPGVIIIEFLPPIPRGLSRRAFMTELEERIETASEHLRVEAQADAANPALL